MRRGGKIALCAVCVIAAMVAVYVGMYFAAVKLSENGEFKTAQKLIFAPFVTDLHDPQFTAYLTAGCEMTDNDFAAAKEDFEALGDYRASKELADGMTDREIQYLASQKQYDEAIKLFRQSDNKDLKAQVYYDAGMYYLREAKNGEKAQQLLTHAQSIGIDVDQNLFAEAYYQWAVNLTEEESYFEALHCVRQAQALHSGEYEEAIQLIETITETMYNKGIEEYRAGRYSEAGTWFSNIDKRYKRCKDYLNLIYARRKDTQNNRIDFQDLTCMKELFDFEDTSSILLTNSLWLNAFLEGTWHSEGGDYYFTVAHEGNVSCNLPEFGFGDYYRFNNGVYELYRESDGASQPLFEFTLLSPDSINVYCYQNGRTYTLYRG